MPAKDELRVIYDVLHAIHDRCEDEGDRIYLGSTNDRHTLLRQLRRLDRLITSLPAADNATPPAPPAHPPADDTGAAVIGQGTQT